MKPPSRPRPPPLPFLVPKVQMWWLEIQQPSESQRPQLRHLCATKLRTVSIYLQTSQYVRELNPVYISHCRHVFVPSSCKHHLIKNVQHLSPRAQIIRRETNNLLQCTCRCDLHIGLLNTIKEPTNIWLRDLLFHSSHEEQWVVLAKVMQVNG